jgi:hypothetical protein
VRDVIAQLELQRAAIERALSALREVEGIAAQPVAAAPAARRGRPPKASREGRLSPEGRARLIAALKTRWAAKKAAAAATTNPPVKRGRPKKSA